MRIQKLRGIFLSILLTALMSQAFYSCDNDEINDALSELEDQTGNKIIINENDTGISEPPEGWTFLFGMEVSEANAANLDNTFSMDLNLLKEAIDVDLSTIEQMIAIAKIDDIPDYGKKLRFANRLIVQNGKLMLDSDALAQLGDSIGSSGAGIYVVYYAQAQNGYIRGNIVGCEDEEIVNAQAVISKSPFFTYSAANGT